MKKSFYIFLILIVAVLFDVSISTSADYSIIQLTSTNDWEQNPQINNKGHVVWVGGRRYGLFAEKPGNVFLYDGSTITQLTNDSGDVHGLRINNNSQIVWYNWSGVFFYDGKKIIQLNSGSGATNIGSHGEPQLSDNGHVVWTECPYGESDNSEVYLFNGTRTARLTNNDYNEYSPTINNSGHVAWGEYDGSDFEIFFYNGTTTIQLTNNNYGDYEPQINNSDHIVWGIFDGSDTEIVLYNGTTTVQLTDNDYNDISPKFSNSGHVVWYIFDGSDKEIVLYNGTTTVQLTDNDYDDLDFQINNSGHVVWRGFDGSDREIYVYDGLTITQLTINSRPDNSPQINDNGHIVWYGSAESGDEIFYATPVQSISGFKMSEYFPLTSGNILMFDRNAFTTGPDSHDFSNYTGISFIDAVQYHDSVGYIYSGIDGIFIVGFQDPKTQKYIDLSTTPMKLAFGQMNIGDSMSSIIPAGLLEPFSINITSTLEDVETITTPAGIFNDTLRLKLDISHEDCNYTEIIWLAKGMGIVKAFRMTESPVNCDRCLFTCGSFDYWNNGVQQRYLTLNKYLIHQSDNLDTTYCLPVFKPQPGHWSGLGIVNLSSTKVANVTVTVYDQDGIILVREIKSLAANGQKAFLVGPGLDKNGWIKVASDQPLAGLNLLGEYGVDTTDYFLSDVPFTQTLSTSLIIPHVAQNSEWDTTIFAANPNNSTAIVTFIYADQDGVTSTPYILNIPPNGSTEVSMRIIANSNTIKKGSVTISSTKGLSAFAIYNNLKTGNYSNAGINAVNISK